jgi:hypothetical protein
MTEEKRLNLPVWYYQADITNGAGGAGAHSYTVTVSSRSRIEVLYGGVLNGDTTSRTVTVVVDDGTEEFTRLVSLSLSTGILEHFPDTRAGIVGAGARVILGGGMRVVATIVDVAASQDSAFAIACEIQVGSVPTAVEVGASTPTININREEIL